MSERKHPHFTPDAVLEWMDPHRTYTTTDIAKAFGVPQQYAWDMIKTLRRSNDIERVTVEKRVYQWAKKMKRAPLRTSVAGPQLGPDLTRTIQGYDAEMRRRIDLAMSTRRVALKR